MFVRASRSVPSSSWPFANSSTARKRFRESSTLSTTIRKTCPQSPPNEKRYFLALFEQVAIFVNSGLIPVGVAHYMFGYYAITAWDTPAFWENMAPNERADPYWAVFRTFVEAMRLQEAALRNFADKPRQVRRRLRF
jgi:hypothetical protein